MLFFRIFGVGFILYIFAKVRYNKMEAVNTAQWKAGDCMPSGIEVIKAALDDFLKIQEYMLLARKENATETYARLKKEYLTLKALLSVSGVNFADLDEIKE